MKIECILKRAGGTKVSLGAALYHFKPDDEDRHVAEVENQDHVKVFLNIAEGYRSLDPLPAQKVSLDDAMAVLRAQFPNADFSALTGGTGAAKKTTPPAKKEPAAPATPAPAQTEVGIPTASATENTDEQDGDEADDGDDDDSGLSDMSDAEIRAEFEKLVGRKPHANMLRENMVAQIVAALNDSGK